MSPTRPILPARSWLSLPSQILDGYIIDSFCYRASHIFSYHCYGMSRVLAKFTSALIFSQTKKKVFFPRSVTKENGYNPRVASNATATQTEADGFISPELVQASMHMQMHSHLTSLSGSPKSVSREGTPSPPPVFLRRAYTRSSSDIPVEVEMPARASRRVTLPESVLHHFVRSPSF